MQRTRKRFWWVKWIAIGLVLVGLAGVGTVWLMFQHVPAWYRPVEVAPDDLQAVRDDLIRVQSGFGEQLAMAEGPFEVRLSQAQINAWLAVREEIWPLSREWLPPGVSNPFVSLEAEGIRLAATCQIGSLQTVASVLIGVRADDQHMTLRLLDARGGALPVPTDTLRDQLSRLEGKGFGLGTMGISQGRANGAASLTRLLEGIVLDNSVAWYQPRRTFRVIGLQVKAGELVATVRPMAFQRPQR